MYWTVQSYTKLAVNWIIVKEKNVQNCIVGELDLQ